MVYNYKEDLIEEFKLLKNGQTAGLQFIHSENKGRHYYSVVFGIADKKKQLMNWLYERGKNPLELQVTGKGDLEGTIWAYNMIKDFSEGKFDFFYPGHNKDDTTIIVGWADAKRKKIYTHFLTKIGFELCRNHNGWHLRKIIKKLKKIEI